METGKVLSSDEIVELFKDVYEVAEEISEAENGNAVQEFKPFVLLDAINVILDNQLTENQFSVMLPSEAVRELKDMREEVEAYIASKTRQSTLDQFAL